jgi:hypothetical protein
MANMGYCRFHNTVQDMEDCMEYLYDTDLSTAEMRERKRFIELCQEVAEEFSDGYFNDEED